MPNLVASSRRRLRLPEERLLPGHAVQRAGELIRRASAGNGAGSAAGDCSVVRIMIDYFGQQHGGSRRSGMNQGGCNRIAAHPRQVGIDEKEIRARSLRGLHGLVAAGRFSYHEKTSG